MQEQKFRCCAATSTVARVDLGHGKAGCHIRSRRPIVFDAFRVLAAFNGGWLIAAATFALHGDDGFAACGFTRLPH
jgi:hypothetical protein